MKKIFAFILSAILLLVCVSCRNETTTKTNETTTVQKTVETPQEEVPVEKFDWDSFGTVKYSHGEVIEVKKTNVRTVVKISGTTFEEFKQYIELLKEDSFEWHDEYEDFLEERIELEEVMKTSFWTGKNEKENTFVTVKFFDNESMSYTNYNVILTYYNGPLDNGDI